MISKKTKVTMLIGALFIILSLVIVFRENNVEIVLISGVTSPFQLELELNGESIYKGTIQSNEIIHPRINIETSKLRNNLVVVTENQVPDKSYDFLCLYDKWIIILFYEEEENTSGIGVTIESSYFNYYSW